MKSVPNVPSYEEYFGLFDNFIEESEFEVSDDDERIQQMLLIMLGLLEEFYILHMYDEAYYYSSESFKEDINEFNQYLKDNLLVLFNNYVNDLINDYDAEWHIQSGIVEILLDIEEIVDSGIDSVTDTLYTDLKDKADYYTVLAYISGEFTVHGNFRRAIKKLVNQIRFKSDTIQKTIKRRYDEFVYGQDALFKWVCSGINTCAWCYEIEAMGAMPLSWFPIDHVNGRCVLVPVEPEVYSDEYNRILGGFL